MSKYIFLSKYTKINSKLKNFRFIFNDKTSKIVFENKNNQTSYILDKSFKDSNDEFYISNKYVYMVYILSKLLDLNIKNIKVYNEDTFPQKLEIIEDNIIELYNSFEIENDNFIITNDLVKKVKFGSIIAKKVIDKDLKLICIEQNVYQIYEISGAIKALDKSLKIILIGNTKTPTKDLMTNPVDFILLDKKNLDLLFNAVKNNGSFDNIKSLYFYDKDLNVRNVD